MHIAFASAWPNFNLPNRTLQWRLTMQTRALLILGLVFTSGGCASTVTAWKNDPLQSYEIEASSIYAMTGDRRTAVIFRDEATKKNRFCAESLPDAVAAFSAASKANASVQDKATVGFEDAAYAGLLQTFQRTEIAEIYRQLGWNLCLAWAQGATDDPNYMKLLTKFTDGGLDAIAKRAAQDQVFPTVAPVTLNVGPGGNVGAAVGTAPKPAEDPIPKPAIDLGNGVKLEAAATSATGYCIKAAEGYVGGEDGKPAVSTELPVCKP
jgi:hypothetical protein